MGKEECKTTSQIPAAHRQSLAIGFYECDFVAVIDSVDEAVNCV